MFSRAAASGLSLSWVLLFCFEQLLCPQVTQCWVQTLTTEWTGVLFINPHHLSSTGKHRLMRELFMLIKNTTSKLTGHIKPINDAITNLNAGQPHHGTSTWHLVLGHSVYLSWPLFRRLSEHILPNAPDWPSLSLAQPTSKLSRFLNQCLWDVFLA